MALHNRHSLAIASQAERIVAGAAGEVDRIEAINDPRIDDERIGGSATHSKEVFHLIGREYLDHAPRLDRDEPGLGFARSKSLQVAAVLVFDELRVFTSALDVGFRRRCEGVAIEALAIVGGEKAIVSAGQILRLVIEPVASGGATEAEFERLRICKILRDRAGARGRAVVVEGGDQHVHKPLPDIEDRDRPGGDFQIRLEEGPQFATDVEQAKRIFFKPIEDRIELHLAVAARLARGWIVVPVGLDRQRDAAGNTCLQKPADSK